MGFYAGIGSRRLSEKELEFCATTGAWLAKKGWHLKTGAAVGADQAFAEGALSAGGKVTLCLPWWSYEKNWVEAAKQRGAIIRTLEDSDEAAYQSVDLHHPNAANLTRGPRALHARNYLIVEGTTFILAHPKKNKWGWGGTGQGMLLGEYMGIDVFNFEIPEQLKKITDKIHP